MSCSLTTRLAETRRLFHDSPHSPYGTEVNGQLLGSKPARR